MPKTGHFYHESKVVADKALTGTAFAASSNHEHNFSLSLPPPTAGRVFSSQIEGVEVQLKTIAGGTPPTKVTIRLCYDATGNQSFLPDTEATIALGIGAATEGTVAYSFKMPIRQEAGQSVFLFFKIDSGTATVSSSRITWSE